MLVGVFILRVFFIRVLDFFMKCYFVLLLWQACFRRNLTVVTIYASLGEEALVHSLNEVRDYV